jgi:hypothetical protein
LLCAICNYYEKDRFKYEVTEDRIENITKAFNFMFNELGIEDFMDVQDCGLEKLSM